jgi:phycocyanobilin lyase beta subunit
MEDPETSVRHCAALALAGRSDQDAIASLTSALSSPDRLLARLAANSLVSTGSAAVPALLDLLEHNAEAPRAEVVRALALIGDPRAIPALFNATEDDSALAEYWAEEGLERMGGGMVYFKPE